MYESKLGIVFDEESIKLVEKRVHRGITLPTLDAEDVDGILAIFEEKLLCNWENKMRNSVILYARKQAMDKPKWRGI